jgi:hypothetical protein
MIDVEHITVNVRMPSDEVRIVAMQPFIEFHSKTEEPYRWSNDFVDKQMAAINRTLNIAKDGFNGRSANYILFPEYAVPGIVGAAAINDKIFEDNWPNESIIIAGLHGISKNEYEGLCDVLTAQVSQSNTPNSVPDDLWVNCCVIWIKEQDGGIRTWLQPKIRPAWPEMAVTCNDMFCGSYVYVFECQYEPSGYPCRFTSLVCFDWVAAVAGTTVCHELLTKLTELRAPNPTPLDWVFVVQHNLNPNHPTFLNSTYRFLTDVNTHPFIERDKAIVVHANTAVSTLPNRNGAGGFSACVFSPSAQINCNICRPTACSQPSLLRANTILDRCKDVVFREMGECIHAFTVRVPRFLTPDATDRTFPMPMAHVYATCDTTDPRLCGGSVPAAVKWINDSLDEVELLSAVSLTGLPLKIEAETIEPSIVADMRASDGHSAARYLNWAACSYSHGRESRDEDHRNNADLWGEPETNALEHVLHSLTSVGLAYSIDVNGDSPHGSFETDEGFVQVIAIRGVTHQDCRRHYDNFVPKQGSDPILVITRDRDNNTPTREELMKLDETDTESGLTFLDYQTLTNKCRNAADRTTLKENLNDYLPRHRRII